MDNFLDLKLNEMQKMAVLSNSKHILVTAGAGSGKTRVLTERILNLINCKYINPENILAITFTNKASGVMKERLSEKGLDVRRLWISTFHSSCVRILRENASKLNGYNSNFTIYDESDKNKIITEILKDNGYNDEKFKKNLLFHISNFKIKFQTLDKYLNDNAFDSNIDEIVKCIKLYEDKMRENNAFDFDDLLQKTFMLLKTNSDVLSYYQNKFKHILVDEFQDTNEIQYDFIKLLAGTNNNVFVVGDEDQCIYSWRGANYKNISNFTKDFDNVEIIKLEQNYRSTKKIIEGANKIISKNIQRIDKKLWTDNDLGKQIEYKSCYDEREEAENVASTILALKNYDNYSYKDIAILVRLNSLTRNIEEKLLNYGINYRVYGGMKFYDRLEIKNFLAYLKVLNNPKDDVSFAKIANWPKRNVGEATVQTLKNLDPTKSMLENLLNLQKFNVKGAILTKLLPLQNLFLDFIQKKDELELLNIVEYIIARLNLEEFLNKEEEDKNRMLNIEQLVLSIKEFSKNNEDSTISSYLQSVTLVSDMDSYDEDEDVVTIATVHASKGLEFKCVFIIGLEEGIFPLCRQDSECDDEEERRLMYVAVTRGMERLFLSSCKKRFMYGYSRDEKASNFLKDLGFVKTYQNDYRNSFQDDYYGGYTRYNHDEGYKNGSNYSGFSNNYDSGEFSKPENVSVTKATEIKISNVDDKDFKVGDRVRHTKFGEGIILSINGDMGKISFKGIGTKELIINIAPLTKL